MNGNSSTCTSTVTVLDTVPPVVACQNITIYLDGNGQATITEADVNAGAGDNCGLILSIEIDSSEFDCDNIGDNDVTLTISDVENNVSSCIAVVTVLDSIAPVAICQDITVQLDASGNVFITPADIDNGSSDNCDIDTMTIDLSDFDCSLVGDNTVTLMVTDGSGNSTTCSATVTVEDTLAPNLECKDIMVYLDDAGNASITPEDLIDNLLVIDLLTDIFAGETSLEVTDSNGAVVFAQNSLSSSTSYSFEVLLGCGDHTFTIFDSFGDGICCAWGLGEYSVSLGGVELASGGAFGASEATNFNVGTCGTSDNCDTVDFALDITSFDCSNVGDNPVIITATDANGNSIICNATVTVEDTIAPAIICQDTTIYLDANGEASIVADDLIVGGTISVTVNGSNNLGGLSGSTDFEVNIISDAAIDFNWSYDMPATELPGFDNFGYLLNGVYVQLTSDGIGDQSGSASVSVTTGDVFGFRTATVDNDFGATTGMVSSFSPGFNGQFNSSNWFMTLNNSDDSAFISLSSSTVDACGIDSISADVTDFTCSDIGDNSVEITVVDVNGNTSSCTANVTVLDTIAPIVVCQNITLQLDANGQATLTANDVDGGTTDNCALDSISIDISSFDCSDIGLNDVTLTAVDSSGNTSSCVAVVTVADTVPPIAVCQNITVYLDVVGNVSITASDVDGGSTDNCAIDSISVDEDSFDCSDVGPNNVTLTVVDSSGNSASCVAVVTVLDTIAPTAVCQDITVYLDGSGQVTIAASDVDGGSGDACGIDSLSIDENSFDCTDIGDNVVILTVTDSLGNSASCVAVVTVLDTVPPVAVCLDTTIYLDANGQISIAATDLDGGSSDNCGIEAIEVMYDSISENSLTTTFVSNNAHRGNMFDLVALNDITINSFDVNSQMPAGQTENFEVYYKVGTWIGSDGVPGDWTLVGATSRISNGDGIPTPLALNLGIAVASGQTVAFYVTATGTVSLSYTNGSSTGAVFASDANLQFLEGVRHGISIWHTSI